MDLRNSPEDLSQRMLNALELVAVMAIHWRKDSFIYYIMMNAGMDIISRTIILLIVFYCFY